MSEETVEVTLKLPKQITDYIKDSWETDNLPEILTKATAEDMRRLVESFTPGGPEEESVEEEAEEESVEEEAEEEPAEEAEEEPAEEPEEEEKKAE